MRIHFADLGRAHKAAKRLRKHLDDAFREAGGITLPLSWYQEATAFMAGFDDWYGLKKDVDSAQSQSTPLDSELEDDELRQRRQWQAERLKLYIESWFGRLLSDEVLMLATLAASISGPTRIRLDQTPADRAEEEISLGRGDWEIRLNGEPVIPWLPKPDILASEVIHLANGASEAAFDALEDLPEDPSRAQQIKIGQKLLKLDPFDLDGHLLMAQATADRTARIAILEEAAQYANLAWTEAARLREDDGFPVAWWYDSARSRPFFRILHALVFDYLETGTPQSREMARKLGARMLYLCSNDPLGLRSTLAAIAGGGDAQERRKTNQPSDHAAQEQPDDGPDSNEEGPALGDVPLANALHLTINFGPIEYPKWIVAWDQEAPDEVPFGYVVNVEQQWVSRWTIVPHDDSLIAAVGCGFKLKEGHLIILPGHHLGAGRGVSLGDRLRSIAPVLDFLIQPCAHRDQPDGNRSDKK